MAFLKGHIPWHKGTRGLVKPNSGSFIKGEHPNKETEIKKGQRLSPSTEFKKTEIITLAKLDRKYYRALHKRIERMFGKPDTCEECNTSGLSGRKIHWANISREYKLIREDWIRLCAKCHYEFDSYRKHN